MVINMARARRARMDMRRAVFDAAQEVMAAAEEAARSPEAQMVEADTKAQVALERLRDAQTAVDQCIARESTLSELRRALREYDQRTGEATVMVWAASPDHRAAYAKYLAAWRSLPSWEEHPWG